MANDRPLLLDVTRLIWRRWVGHLPTGIDRVCLAYLAHYRGCAQAVVQRRGYRRIFSTRASDQLFDALLAPRAGLKADMVRILGGENLRALKSLPGLNRLYLNVGHTALHDPGYLKWSRNAQVRPVYMVHDLIPITHPEYCREGEARRHEQRIRNMLNSAVGVIGNSQATLDSLSAFADSARLPMPAAIAAPLGTDVAFTPGDNKASGRPTFVVLGTIEARKNHLMLLRLWRRLASSMGSAAPQLVIIGQRGWRCDEVFQILDHDQSLRGAVREINGCSDAELARHLAGARALLFPSLVEGYGLPLVEALGSGIPVIASDLPVFHEIGQEIPDFVDPLDERGWEEIIKAYAATDSSEHQAQLDRLKWFQRPDWPSHFDRVDQWLGEL